MLVREPVCRYLVHDPGVGRRRDNEFFDNYRIYSLHGMDIRRKVEFRGYSRSKRRRTLRILNCNRASWGGAKGHRMRGAALEDNY